MITVLGILSKAFATMSMRGPRPLVVCGPSGSGKSTLLKKLFDDFPDTFGFSVSHTTRQPREGESNGVHYHFVTVDDMKAAINNGEFIESACFSGNYYGTSKKAIHDVQSKGQVCVLDIEVQGVEQIRNSDLQPILTFINPPSVEELERRLRGRKTETEDSLKKRLDTAKKEIDYGLQPGNFHVVIHNNNVDEAYDQLKNFIIKELKSQQAQGINVRI